MKKTGVILLIILAVQLLPLNVLAQIAIEPTLIAEYTDAELDKTLGVLTLSKWEDRVKVKVSIPDETPTSSKTLLTTTTELTYRDYKVQVYENSQGVEWDIVLPSRPMQNTFSLKIDTRSPLNWYYQPSLSSEQWPKGYYVNQTHAYDEKGSLVAYRPVDVVGSYAVYYPRHDNMYETGKFMHVYRPKVFDASGDWVWGSLSYGNGLLSVSVDPMWLDHAKYPVRIDPTFGTTSVGASKYEFFAHNWCYGQVKECPVVANVVGISAYLEYSSSANLRTALYDWNGTDPVNKLNETNLVAISNARWYNFTLPDTLINPDNYTLCWGDGVYVVDQWIYYDTVTNNPIYVDQRNAFNDPWQTDAIPTSNKLCSIYATYDEPIGWSAGPTTDYPDGMLKPGNETLGQISWYFYGNESGKVVLLRQLQDGHIDRDDPGAYGREYYTTTIESDFPGNTGLWDNYTWAEATVRYADYTDMNVLRIHLFMGKTENDLFPSYRTHNATAMRYLLRHLSDAKNHSIYYVLDGYPHDNYNVSYWWLNQELNESSILWNTTVQNDFAWVWGQLLDTIYDDSTCEDGLIYIEPWSEWVTDFAAGLILNSRDPYRYDGSGAYGNASLVSWNKWLEQNFDDAAAMQSAFDEGTNDKINATKKEIPFFNNSMPLNTFSSGSVRAHYFTLWYDECIYNFTSGFNTAIKANHTDTLVSWDGWGAYYSFGGALINNADHIPYACIENSDVIDHHSFGGTLTAGNFNHWGADDEMAKYYRYAALARSLGKPLVIGEDGPITSQSTGYGVGADDDNIDRWRLVTNAMITQGYAGWTPYWCSYIHAYASSNNYADDADRRMEAVKEVNREWVAAENYCENITYNNITLLVGLGSVYRADYSGKLLPYLYSKGYTPKYLVYSKGNGTRQPTTIPNDTDVLIIGGDYYSSYQYFASDLQMINDWLTEDYNHKLIIHYYAGQDNHLNTLRLEDHIDTALFPINNMAYGVGYKDWADTTDRTVTIDGDTINLDRTPNYHCRHSVNWTETDITGDILLQIDGLNEPFVIANSHIAWIGATNEQFENVGNVAFYPERDIWKIYQTIFDYWGIQPTVYPNSDTRETLLYSNLGENYGIIMVGNQNYTDSETYTFKLNQTTHNLNGPLIIFDELAETTTEDTAANIETTGITTTLTANNTNHIVIRNYTRPCYLFSDGYLVNETWFTANNTLRLEFTSPNDNDRNCYVYWNTAPTGNLRYNNGTTLPLIDFYDSGEGLIDFSYIDDVIVWLDGLNIAPNAPNITSANMTRYNPGASFTVSWNFSDPSPANDNQTAYEVEIDDAATFLTPVIDTGKVTSTQTNYTNTVPTGLGLYYMRVRNWDEFNEPGGWNSSTRLIVDRVNITGLWVNNTTPGIDETVEISCTAALAYDGHVLNGSAPSNDTLTLRSSLGDNIVMTYNGTHWVGSLTKTTVSTAIINNYQSVLETNYTITVLGMAGFSETITWDVAPVTGGGGGSALLPLLVAVMMFAMGMTGGRRR